MSPKLELYLAQATSGIKPIKKRKAIRNELEEHLLTSIDHYSKNYSNEDAVEKAILDMGKPEEILEEFRKVYSSTELAITRILFVTLLIFTSSLLFPVVKESLIMMQWKTQTSTDIEEASRAVQSQMMDDNFILGNIKFHFSHAYLLPNNTLMLQFDYEKINKLSASTTSLVLLNENAQIRNFFPLIPKDSSEYATNAFNNPGFHRSLLYVSDMDHIPKTLSLEFGDFGSIKSPDKPEIITLRIYD